jgi:xanthine dehydrogenase YagS FAD-binding subunit
VITSARPKLAIDALFGDGRDGTRDSTLATDEVIIAIALPPPMHGERAVYHRTISRAEAEWPLVEAVVRIVRDGEHIRLARVAVGGVAPVPLRLLAVEQALEGARVDHATLDHAAKAAVAGAKPLPETGYKVTLLAALIRDLLEQAWSAEATRP